MRPPPQPPRAPQEEWEVVGPLNVLLSPDQGSVEAFIAVRGGKPMVTADGDTIYFDRRETAQHAIDDFGLTRAPSFEELRTMSDEELRSRSLGG
jgi:hypothetical protein